MHIKWKKKLQDKRPQSVAVKKEYRFHYVQVITQIGAWFLKAKQ